MYILDITYLTDKTSTFKKLNTFFLILPKTYTNTYYLMYTFNKFKTYLQIIYSFS